MDELTFKPMAHEHLALLHRWLSEPHVSAWWGEPGAFKHVLDEFGPSVNGDDACRCYVICVDGAEVGMVQSYMWSSYPPQAAEVGAQPGDAGIDYLLGERSLIGQGLGPRVVSAFLEQVLLKDPDVAAVRTTVAVANRRSWRCLEKVGFEREAARAVSAKHSPHYVMVLRAPTPPTPPSPKDDPENYL